MYMRMGCRSFRWANSFNMYILTQPLVESEELLVSFFFAMKSQSLSAAKPSNIPKIIPQRTSVGKCRNRYILLKAIRAEIMNTAIPGFLNFMKMAVAPAKAHAEWVEGNDELVGRLTSISKAWSIWQGLGLLNRFFKMNCPNTKTPTYEISTAIPVRLVFFGISRAAPTMTHNCP